MLDRRRLLVLGGGLLAALGTRPLAAASAAPAGYVFSVTGMAFGTTDAAERALKHGEAVLVRDLIRTGGDGRIGLRLGASTTIHLGPSSRLRIDRHLLDAGGEFELAEGGMVYDHRAGPAGGRAAGGPKAAQPATVDKAPVNRAPVNRAPVNRAETVLRSPYGLIAVRGTRFFAGPSQGVFGVFVADGAVDVAAAGKTVRLTAGLGTNIAQVGSAPSDAARWRPARVRAALLAVTGKVR